MKQCNIQLHLGGSALASKRGGPSTGWLHCCHPANGGEPLIRRTSADAHDNEIVQTSVAQPMRLEGERVCRNALHFNRENASRKERRAAQMKVDRRPCCISACPTDFVLSADSAELGNWENHLSGLWCMEEKNLFLIVLCN